MDSVSPLDSQIEKLSGKLKSSKLPPALLEKAESMASLLRSDASKIDSVANYINWITKLPFGIETSDNLDLKTAKQILDKNHYGLEPIKERILEYLASLILQKQSSDSPSAHSVNSGQAGSASSLQAGSGLGAQDKSVSKGLRAPILCLVGLVGTGKTTLAYSVAEALGRKFERIPFGGMGESKVLRGQSRSLADAEPGLLIKTVAAAGSANPVILLDELDRITEATRADVMGVLVELLDPEQNKGFVDHYIDYPFDLSNVLFIATANNTTNIATAVLDRLEVVQMPSYNDGEKLVIAKSYLFPKIRTATGLLDNQIVIADDVWPNIIRPLGYDPGTRGIERVIEGICRKAAKLIVDSKVPQVSITNENLKDFLQI